MIRGNIVFEGDIENAVLLECNKTRKVSYYKCLIYSEQLTNEIALLAIGEHVAGIITDKSSFATHGANILRTSFNNGELKIPWITNVKKEDLDKYFGSEVCLEHGCIISLDDKKHNFEAQATEFIPIKNRTIVQYNVCKNESSLCYWPYRKYDRFTFSIMKKGLKENFKWLFLKEINIELDEDGHIWFANGIFLQEIIKIARNHIISTPFLERQINTYDGIIKKVYHPIDLSNCIVLLEKYFSVFILYHNSYEQVLLEIYECLKKACGEELAIKGMDIFLFCDLDKWMLENELKLEKGKSLFSNEPLTPIPDFTIYDDINKKQSDIFNFLKRENKESFYQRYEDKIKYWVKVFVTKEWKFVINKILFSRCSKLIRELSDKRQIDILDIKKMSNEELLTKI